MNITPCPSWASTFHFYTTLAFWNLESLMYCSYLINFCKCSIRKSILCRIMTVIIQVCWSLSTIPICPLFLINSFLVFLKRKNKTKIESKPTNHNNSLGFTWTFGNIWSPIWLLLGFNEMFSFCLCCSLRARCVLCMFLIAWDQSRSSIKVGD